MHSIVKNIDEDLLKKYSYEAFMYTEYPHKRFWRKDFGEDDFKEGLKSIFSDGDSSPLLLYVHIPFCPSRCFYCTCHTFITNDYERIRLYLKALFKEIALYADFFKKNSFRPLFREIHIGGGSPTIIKKKEFSLLIDKLKSIAFIDDVVEFSIEIDPRVVTKDDLKYYHEMGVNRISLGVQDFDISVQKAINRVQPPELVEELLIPEVRDYFDKGINFDIICGLPHQTQESIRKTFERIVKISPDRICFNYLHYLPKSAKHQEFMFDGKNGRPDRLPDFYEKKRIFNEGLRVLLENGYVRTGYDHFAKPDDEVAKAMKYKKMRWNALGVTSGRYVDVLGIGVHSYSTMGEYYSQNICELSEYENTVFKGRFPIYRGLKLKKDDLIRRDIIQSLRNFFFLDIRDIEKRYVTGFKEYFEDELDALLEFSEDGLVKIKEDLITITEIGQQFANLVCRNFDSYIPKLRPKVQGE